MPAPKTATARKIAPAFKKTPGRKGIASVTPSPAIAAFAAPPLAGLTALSVSRPQGLSRDFTAVPDAVRSACVTRPSPSAAAIPPAPADTLVRSERDLVVRLGQMPVELAAPLLLGDVAALDATALLALVRTTGEAHQTLIARRKGLDWRVVKALIATGNENVLLTLAENADAMLDDDDRRAMSRYAEGFIMVRGALLSRKGFVFAAAPAKLNADDGVSHSNLRLLKLARAGRHGLFIREAARRLHVTANALAATLSASTEVSLALVTCALGMDRAVFVHLLPYWRASHGLPARTDVPYKALLLSVFSLSADDARRKLTAGMGVLA